MFPLDLGETKLMGPVFKCFVIPPNSKLEENSQEIVSFTPAASQIKEHDQIMYASKVHIVSLGSY